MFHYFKANEVLRIKFTDIRRWLGEYSLPLVFLAILFPAIIGTVSTMLGCPANISSLHLNNSSLAKFFPIQFLNCRFNFRVKLKIFSEHPLAVGIILNISLMCINTKAGPPAPPLASHHRHILGADLQFLQFCLISMNDQLSDRHARRIFYLF